MHAYDRASQSRGPSRERDSRTGTSPPQQKEWPHSRQASDEESAGGGPGGSVGHAEGRSRTHTSGRRKIPPPPYAAPLSDDDAAAEARPRSRTEATIPHANGRQASSHLTTTRTATAAKQAAGAGSTPIRPLREGMGLRSAPRLSEKRSHHEVKQDPGALSRTVPTPSDKTAVLQTVDDLQNLMLSEGAKGSGRGGVGGEEVGGGGSTGGEGLLEARISKEYHRQRSQGDIVGVVSRMLFPSLPLFSPLPPTLLCTSISCERTRALYEVCRSPIANNWGPIRQLRLRSSSMSVYST